MELEVDEINAFQMPTVFVSLLYIGLAERGTWAWDIDTFCLQTLYGVLTVTGGNQRVRWKNIFPRFIQLGIWTGTVKDYCY